MIFKSFILIASVIISINGYVIESFDESTAFNDAICQPSRNFTDPSPCEGIEFSPITFPNPRGCDWYFLCRVGQLDQECRCAQGDYYNTTSRACEVIDDPWICDPYGERVADCPSAGLAYVANEYACNEFTRK